MSFNLNYQFLINSKIFILCYIKRSNYPDTKDQQKLEKYAKNYHLSFWPQPENSKSYPKSVIQAAYRYSLSQVVKWLFSFFYSFLMNSSLLFSILSTYRINPRTCFVLRVLISMTIVSLIPIFLKSYICSYAWSFCIFFANFVKSLNSKLDIISTSFEGKLFSIVFGIFLLSFSAVGKV